MKTLACIVLLILLSGSVNAQFELSYEEHMAALKNGTTYVVMKDPASEIAQDYIEVFKKYWTISKVEFIKSSEITAHNAKGNFFLTICSWTKTTQSTATSSTVHIYLGLWTCKDSYFGAKTKKKLSWENVHMIGRIELYTDFKTLCNPDDLYKYDYDGGGHIRNWGPGILKNYLQEFMVQLDKGKERSIFAPSSDKAQLNLIKKETLYIPDYILIKFGAMTGDESKKHTEKEIFTGYKYPYQLISTEELNQKILNDTIPFYHLQYVKSSTDKFVSIFNSTTGEMIYTIYTPMAYNFKKEDMMRISETILGK